MVRTTILKSNFKEVSLFEETLYDIMWDKVDVKEPIMVEDEETKKLVPSGEYKDTDYCVVTLERMNRKPSFDCVKNMIIEWFNKETDYKIEHNFVWNGMQVELTTENQFNYKVAYDLAVQTNGATLPVIFKFGSSDAPQYHKFETLEDLTDFYTKAVKFVNDTLAEGWALKDSIDWNKYKESLEAV